MSRSFGDRCRQHDASLDACREGVLAQDAPAPACRADPSLALLRPHAGTRADRSAGPAPGRPTDRARNLLWPLSRCPAIWSRPAASRRSRSRWPIPAGKRPCTAFAGFAICAPPAPNLPPPMPARWSPTGSPPWQPYFRCRLGARHDGQARHRLAAAFLGGAAGCGISLLPGLPEIAGHADPLSPGDGTRDAGRQGQAARPHRACLCRSVASGAGIGAARRDPQPRRGARPSDSAGWRPYFPQSDGRAGDSRRPSAAAPDLCQPGRNAAGGADQRVDRMLPALRFFRHQDGSLARFNGMGATIHDRIAAILRHDDTDGAPLLHAPHSGYERLSHGRHHRHRRHRPAAAGRCLQRRACRMPVVRAVVGPPAFRRQLRRRHLWRRRIPAACPRHGRAFDGHLNDTSSARFSHSLRVNDLLGPPLIGGPQECALQAHRLSNGMQGFIASHDGYVARFGLLSRARTEIVDGRQCARRQGPPSARRAVLRSATTAAISSPSASTSIPTSSLLQDEQDRLVLTALKPTAGYVTCTEVAPEVEESIYFAGLGGPRRSRQIVLAFKASRYPGSPLAIDADGHRRSSAEKLTTDG